MQDVAAREAVFAFNGLPGATWVETGTYLGETTAFLAARAWMVYSIEPDLKLFIGARQRFEHCANVQIINGLSEDIFPKLLPTLHGDVCFWLDGHYTDETTHKGPQDTPIADELACIGEHISRWGRVVVLIDDVHLFNGQTHIYGAYPHIDDIAAWAHKHRMSGHIEHDIFIAKT